MKSTKYHTCQSIFAPNVKIRFETLQVKQVCLSPPYFPPARFSAKKPFRKQTRLERIKRQTWSKSTAYAMTRTKSQGQTLDKVIVSFDSNKVGPGSAYVALSRIRRREDLIVITRMLYAHITPVTETYEDML